jgi:hypothetical protein
MRSPRGNPWPWYLRATEPEVRVDHALLGGEIAALDALSQLDLLLCGEQGMAPGLVEEELEGIGRHLRLEHGALILGRNYSFVKRFDSYRKYSVTYVL